VDIHPNLGNNWVLYVDVNYPIEYFTANPNEITLKVGESCTFDVDLLENMTVTSDVDGSSIVDLEFIDRTTGKITALSEGTTSVILTPYYGEELYLIEPLNHLLMNINVVPADSDVATNADTGEFDYARAGMDFDSGYLFTEENTHLYFYRTDQMEGNNLKVGAFVKHPQLDLYMLIKRGDTIHKTWMEPCEVKSGTLTYSVEDAPLFQSILPRESGEYVVPFSMVYDIRLSSEATLQ
jgi:hypothetical protein